MAFYRPKERTQEPAAVPGVFAPDEQPDSSLLTLPQEARKITEEDIKRATEILQKYKQGKSNLEKRVIEEEKWWQIRHWEVLKGDKSRRLNPTSAWLFNTLNNKHADAMDNYPEPNILPREQGDEKDAKMLSAILPVVRERNEYEQTYSDNWWEKLKHGTAVYGVFWNNELENGLGDIDIRTIDLLNIFWEPGVTNVQKSRNMFTVELVDNDMLTAQYPQLEGKAPGNIIDVAKYIYDDAVDTTDKSAVVDWYYKVRSASGRKILHYVKFVGATVLYASENDPQYTECGFYDHGMYPFVFDTLFPEKGTPVGFGYVSVCKDPQMYIDRLKGALLENAIVGAIPRYWKSSTAGVNEDDFLDLRKRIIEVEGGISDDKLRPVEYNPLPGNYLELLQMQIDEMKETSSNRDFSTGGTASGVTAAAAIAALQEAGNKTSRDMIAASYRTDKKITELNIELIRQFYTEPRCFRITGESDTGLAQGYQFVQYDNGGIQDRETVLSDTEVMISRPIFDIKVKPQKRNPYSQMSQNEQAKELYKLGAFLPERAQESMMMLDMMEFEGIDKVREQVTQGQTLMNLLKQTLEQVRQLSAIVGAITGSDMTTAVPQGGQAQVKPESSATSLESAVSNAQQTNMTPYGKKLAERSRPDLGKVPSATQPRQ